MNIFERATTLKIVIFPRSDRFHIFHIFITFWSFVWWSKKLFPFSSFLPYENYIPKILIVLVNKLTYSTPQGTTFSPFMTKIPATSHFDMLILDQKLKHNVKIIQDLFCRIFILQKRWYRLCMQYIESHYYRRSNFSY